MTGHPPTSRPDPPPGREVFHLADRSWDITAGLRLAQHYPVVRARITDLAGIARLIAVHPARVAVADLTVPLLVAPVPGAGLLVIDGWHRVHRALACGRTHMPARLLTEADEHRIRLHEH